MSHGSSTSYLCPRLLFVIALGILLAPRGQRASTPSGEAEQKLWSVYWTVAPGYTSTLVMKNNRVKETLTVYPSLYFRSGEEYPLAPVTLTPRETAVVNLNQVVAAMSPGPAREPGEGTLELSFSAPNEAAIGGDISVTNAGRGIAWNFRLYPVRQNLSAQPVRGLFWFPDEDTRGFVAVQNASEEFITITPQIDVATGSYSLPPRRVAPGQGFTFELREAPHSLGLKNVDAGGIKFAYDGPSDAVKADGVLFNDRGFSTQLDFLPYQSHDMTHDLALRTPQFAIGPAGPRLGLPHDTLFEPTIVLHNFDSAPLNSVLAVGLRTRTTSTEKQFPISLSAGETRILPLYPLLRDVVPVEAHWASLEVQYASKQNALAAALVSVSRDRMHSIRSVLNWVMGSASDGPLWQADDTHNTLIGIFNSDTQPARVEVSLDYYVGSQPHKHKLPALTIPPRGAEQIDLSAILAAAEPDADGDTIPSDVNFGGYSVRKVGPRINKVLITGALVFDRQAKSYLTFYNTCCGFLNVTFAPNSLIGFPGGTDQLGIQAQDTCGGSFIDVTNSGSFATLNSSIATVGANNGAASFVAVGHTTLTSQLDLFEKDFFVGDCTPASAGNSAPATVTPSVSFSTISYVVVGQTASTTATVNPQGNSTPISLSISSPASILSPTGTFTQNTKVVVKGLTVGTTTITATVSNSDGSTPTVGSTSFSVTSAAPTATVTQRTSGTVSIDDTASPNYQTVEGTTNLGPIIGSGTLKGCFVGFETIGTIAPSTYTGNVILHRTFVSDATYTNSTSTGGIPPNTDDTSFPGLRADNPQSSSPVGKVYDLDASGPQPPNVDGKTYRIRTNFYAYAALPDGTKISPNYNFYVRVSCTKTASGYQFVNDVPNDN